MKCILRPGGAWTGGVGIHPQQELSLYHDVLSFVSEVAHALLRSCLQSGCRLHPTLYTFDFAPLHAGFGLHLVAYFGFVDTDITCYNYRRLNMGPT